MIQWGTGNVGKHALRTIFERPDFELVGVRVYDPRKIGKDAGELLGREPIGVVASDDTEAILALDADCVCYTALGSTLGSGEAPLNDICRLLASGKNVVSSAVEYHAYLRPGVELEGAGAKAHERLSEACEKGQTSFFHVGINPGFAMDLWPMTLSRLCRRIDHLKVVEIVDMSRYTSIHMVRDAIGFGLPPDQATSVDLRMRDVHRSPFYLSMRMLADGIGVELDGVEYHREVAVADRDLSIAAGSIEAGRVAAIRFRFDGMLRGRPAITLEWVWRVTNDVAPDWPTGESRWILHVDGDPTIDSEIALATSLDSGRATSLAVATLLLNSVRTVVESPPGLLDNLSIPAHGGGHFGAPRPRGPGVEIP
jgi:4-hydroxy-tetrahydrodipicolinate reductase